jgi:hypothetical protein
MQYVVKNDHVFASHDDWQTIHPAMYPGCTVRRSASVLKPGDELTGMIDAADYVLHNQDQRFDPTYLTTRIL